jgi:hypothetical protein
VARRGFLERFTKPVEEADREALAEWSEAQGGRRLDQMELRKPNLMAGEVRSVRIVPRAGADALEATVSDGHGAVIAVFLGRRRIGGISPGRRLRLHGVPFRVRNQVVVHNPLFELC